jgi:CRISPR/Cas system-associated exonuclease Cas4 (RecB family)
MSSDLDAICGVIDTYLRYRSEKSKGDRKYTHYHPSEFGKCLRKSQYKRYSEEKLIEVHKQELDSKQIRLFDKGHNMHSRWASYFSEIGILRGRWKCKNPFCYKMKDGNCIEEHANSGDETLKGHKSRIYGENQKQGVFVPSVCYCGCSKFEYLENRVVDNNLNFAGNCDLILDFTNISNQSFEGVRRSFDIQNLPKKSIVADMKTINAKQFEEKFGLKGSGPHFEYIVQLTIYIHILDCEYGLLIYENKNDSNINMFKVERNQKMFDLISEQAMTLNEMFSLKLLPPPRPKTKNDYECRYCEYKDICHNSSIWEDTKLSKIRKDFYKFDE